MFIFVAKLKPKPNMKKNLISIWLLLVGMTISAQEVELSKEMATLRDYCIAVRTADYEMDVNALKKTIEGWDAVKKTLTYQGVSVSMDILPNFDIIGETGTQDLRGHLVFNPMFIRKMVKNDMDKGGTFIEHAQVMRGGTSSGIYDCRWLHRLLPANGKITMGFVSPASRVIGHQEILIVAEREAPISVTITDSEHHVISQSSPNGIIAATWDIDKQGTFSIEISQQGSEPVSFIIASTQ